MMPTGFEHKIMHASLRIGETQVMLSDGDSNTPDGDRAAINNQPASRMAGVDTCFKINSCLGNTYKRHSLILYKFKENVIFNEPPPYGPVRRADGCPLGDPTGRPELSAQERRAPQARQSRVSPSDQDAQRSVHRPRHRRQCRR